MAALDHAVAKMQKMVANWHPKQTSRNRGRPGWL